MANKKATYVDRMSTKSGLHVGSDSVGHVSGFNGITRQAQLAVAQAGGGCTLNRDGASAPMGNVQGKPMAIKAKTTQGVPFLTGLIAKDQDVLTVTIDGETTRIAANLEPDISEGGYESFKLTLPGDQDITLSSPEVTALIGDPGKEISDTNFTMSKTVTIGGVSKDVTFDRHIVYQRFDGASAQSTHIGSSIEKFGESDCKKTLRELLDGADNYDFRIEAEAEDNKLIFNVTEASVDKNKKCRGKANVAKQEFAIDLDRLVNSDVSFDDEEMMKLKGNGRSPPPVELDAPCATNEGNQSAIDVIRSKLGDGPKVDDIIKKLIKFQNKSCFVQTRCKDMGMSDWSNLRLVGDPPIAGDTDGFAVCHNTSAIDKITNNEPVSFGFGKKDVKNIKGYVSSVLSNGKQIIDNNALIEPLTKYIDSRADWDETLKGEFKTKINERLTNRHFQGQTTMHLTGALNAEQIIATEVLNEVEFCYKALADGEDGFKKLENYEKAVDDVSNFLYKSGEDIVDFVEKNVDDVPEDYKKEHAICSKFLKEMSLTDRLHGMERFNPMPPEAFADISGVQLINGEPEEVYFSNVEDFISFKRAAFANDSDHYVNCSYALPVYRDKDGNVRENTDYDMPIWFDMMKEQIGSLETHYTEALKKENGSDNPYIESQVRDRVENTLGRDVCKQVTDFQEKLTAHRHRQSSNQTVFGKAVDSASVDPQVEQYLAINEERLKAENFKAANKVIQGILKARDSTVDLKNDLSLENANANLTSIKSYRGIKNKGSSIHDTVSTSEVIKVKSSAMNELLTSFKTGAIPSEMKKIAKQSKQQGMPTVNKDTMTSKQAQIAGNVLKQIKHYHDVKGADSLKGNDNKAPRATVFNKVIDKLLKKAHEHKGTIEKNAPEEKGGPAIEKDGREMKGGPS